MAYRQLEIDREEMLKMRDNGMTNMDIANCLGITRQTVLRYIGPQPGKNWEGYKQRMAQPERTNIVPIKPEPEPEAVLVLTNQIKYLMGETAEWCVNPKDRIVMFKTCDTDRAVSISFDDYELFAKEVNAVSRHIKEQHVTPEMW